MFLTIVILFEIMITGGSIALIMLYKRNYIRNKQQPIMIKYDKTGPNIALIMFIIILLLIACGIFINFVYKR